jgi:hypothetical protein
VSEEAERIVYEESVRTLAQQKEVLDGLRARAGTLLAAVSVATAFLSTQALDTPELGALAWSAIVLFCLAVAGGPRHCAMGLDVRPPPAPADRNPPRLGQPATRVAAEHTIRDLSQHLVLERRPLQREQRKAGRHVRLAIACVALVAEIVVWLILLAQ